MTCICSKIVRVLVALAFSLMVMAAMSSSVDAGVLGGQCSHAASVVHDKKPHNDTAHVATCCTDMHCCPLMPSILPADTSVQVGDIVFLDRSVASPLLLIRPIDPPPKFIAA